MSDNSNSPKFIFPAIIAVVLISVTAFTAYSTYSNNSTKTAEVTQSSQSTQKSENTVANLTSSENISEASSQQSEIGKYVEYNAINLADTIGDKNILFFKASWCPSCNSLDKAITSELNNIPTGVNIIKVDYDSNTDLKQKYQITMQHTLVQVDENGKEIQKWSGSTNLEDILNKI